MYSTSVQKSINEVYGQFEQPVMPGRKNENY